MENEKNLENLNEDGKRLRVYHGSYIKVEEPAILNGKFAKDFGDGFYVTNMKEQAERWSKRRTSSVVSVYNLKISNNLKVKIFPNMNDEWLDFVVDCRLNESHEYDLVEGPMADDKIFATVNDYMRGEISREAFFAIVKFRYPTHEICLCTEQAIACLNFLESYEVI